jgi:WD40 repeat protein
MIEAELARFKDLPTLTLEIEAHDNFAEDHCRIFIGRETALKNIADYISGSDRRPLILHGESGSGKSAVMARASQDYKGPARMIRRFIGASPESASIHALLTSLCRQIAPGEVPVDYAQLENAFRERLSMATAEQPMVLFIDALDQLAASDPARDVTWLPPELPLHVKVILSTIDDGERLPKGLSVQLERMTQSEGGQALDELLREAHRTLQPWQRETVMAHFERCGLPLYLKLAAEESRLWKSYTPEDACTLGEGIAGVIDTLFDRLSSNANHGPTLVEHSLGYVAAARYGLREDEVLDVLAADDAVWNDFDQRKHHEVSERRLPMAVWSRLSLDLEPYLTERAASGGTVLAFYHRQLAERVAGRFEVQAHHSDLAHYFLGRPASDTRRAVELVFQQRKAHQWTDVEATLLDCQFLFTKVAANLVPDLDMDYQSLLDGAPEGSLPRREALRLVHSALRLSRYVIRDDPRQFAPQLSARLLNSEQADVQGFYRTLLECSRRPRLQSLWPTFVSPDGGLLEMLGGHTAGVLSVVVSADGGRVLTGSKDEKIILWDISRNVRLQTINTHSGWIFSLAMTPDGRFAASYSEDGTIRLWDLTDGHIVNTVATPHGKKQIAISPDGGHVFWNSSGELNSWATRTGEILTGLTGIIVFGSHGPVVRMTEADLPLMAESGDGQIGVSLAGSTVGGDERSVMRVWDLNSRKVLRTLKGHTAQVNCIALTPDGRRAVSGSADRTVRLWDLNSGESLKIIGRHFADVLSIAVTPDGNRVISGADDGSVWIWDLFAPSSLNSRDLHSAAVLSLAYSPAADLAVSASADTRLKVWDLETGRVVRTLEGHKDNVIGVAVPMDQARAVSCAIDSTVKIWDLRRGRMLRTVVSPGPSARIVCQRVRMDDLLPHVTST